MKVGGLKKKNSCKTCKLLVVCGRGPTLQRRQTDTSVVQSTLHHPNSLGHWTCLLYSSSPKQLLPMEKHKAEVAQLKKDRFVGAQLKKDGFFIFPPSTSPPTDIRHTLSLHSTERKTAGHQKTKKPPDRNTIVSRSRPAFFPR